MARNSEILRDAQSAHSQGDIAPLLALIRDDCVFHEPPELPYGGEYTGPSGLTTVFGKILADYSRSAREVELFEAADDRVVYRALATFTSRKSGASIETAMIEICRFVNEMIVDVEVFYSDPGAVAKLVGG